MRIERESPLRFLDVDVSALIYKTYFPNKKTRINLEFIK